MRNVKLILEKNNTTLVEHCWVADRFYDRFIGLMGREALASNSALLIAPCNSVHSFFMKFKIDVVYLGGDLNSRKLQILSIRPSMKPWRMHLPVWGATAVLELANGKSRELLQGDTICISWQLLGGLRGALLIP